MQDSAAECGRAVTASQVEPSMFIRFKVSNFRSIRDSQELSLVATSTRDHEEVLLEPNGPSIKLLRAAAIYGANASGKSNHEQLALRDPISLIRRLALRPYGL